MKVRYYGHIGQGTGYAVAAEHMCRALLVAGHDLEIRPLEYSKCVIDPFDPLVKHLRTDAELARTAPEATIVHTLPLDVRTVLKRLSGTPQFAPVMQSKLVAYTTLDFSGNMTADMGTVMDGDFDQFWFPCQQNVLQADDYLPGRAMPHAYNQDLVNIWEAAPRQTEKSDRFTFYYVGAWSPRKNVEAVVLAYLRTFRSWDRSRLILRCDVEPRVVQAVIDASGVAAPDRPQIAICRRLAPVELFELHRNADVFVTGTGAEAWNLPAFDAMIAGRHIIHTQGTGADDYLRDTSAAMVRATLVPASDGQRESSWAKWLEPDPQRLTQLMRDAYDQRRSRLEMKYNPADRYNYEAVGALATDYLEKIVTP